MTTTGLINSSSGGVSGPQGLKPAFLLALGGTAEAVPYPDPFMRPLLVFRRDGASPSLPIPRIRRIALTKLVLPRCEKPSFVNLGLTGEFADQLNFTFAIGSSIRVENVVEPNLWLRFNVGPIP